MSLYSTFTSDKTLETEGVAVNFGDFEVVLARAGGANHNFAKVANAKIKPYRRMMDAGSIPPELDTKLTAEIYGTAVVLGWRTKVDGEFVEGVEGPDGELLPPTRGNIIQTLTDLPDLLSEIVAQAQDLALFKAEDREDDLGNS